VKELVVPIGIIAILGSMLLPLPPMVIDFMLVGNLILALILLASSLYITDPLKLSALPSILLLATLYRLALNVSTTRLILGSGEAGKTIEAFGTTVIQGNLIVGAVIFLIITFIQFIVIAKGSERVAEVSARFTLDALPGKQMSIDADVRAGLIDFDTARTKRQDLQVESRFYGALDGSMKFVKGDAIAGIVITAINIIGGFSIGMLMEGREVTSALSKYTTLTVGDGLLSQIPALLNSLAAGMVVTRVVRTEGTSLAGDLISQLGQLRRVKIIIGIFAVGLSFAPGMPAFTFLAVALLLFLSACLRSDTDGEPVVTVNTDYVPRTPPVLQIEAGSEVGAKLYKAGDLPARMNAWRQEVHEKYGLILALPELKFIPELENSFKLKMRGVYVSQGELKEGEESFDVVMDTVRDLVEKRAHEFVDDILTRRTLDFFDAESPELVSAVVPGVVSVTQLTEVLKGLAREGISIRNFDLILQAVSETGSAVSSKDELLQEVRITLRRIISAKYAGTNHVLKGFTLEPMLDLSIAKAHREGDAINIDVLTTIKEFLQTHDITDSVLVVSKGARFCLREYLSLSGLEIPVLAYEELVEEINFTVLGCIENQSEQSRQGLADSLAA